MNPLFHRSAILLIAASAPAACVSEPRPPETPPVAEIASGPERIEWDQPAVAGTDVAAYRFVLYLDGVGKDLTEVSCGELLQSGSHLCTAELPPVAPGRHVVTLAAIVEKDGQRFESRQSVSLAIEKR
jgi:hypothetical protein